MKYMGWIIAGGVALALLGIAGWFIGVYNTGISKQVGLTASYSNNQNVFSAGMLNVKEQAGIANIQSDRGDQAIRNAMEGRYGDDGLRMNGQFINAVSEAYPDLGAILGGYERLADAVSAFRAEFKGTQTKFIDELRAYDDWRGQFPQNMFPADWKMSDKLVAKVNGKSLKGQAAYDQMNTFVLDSATGETFESGKTEAMTFDRPAPAPPQAPATPAPQQ